MEYRDSGGIHPWSIKGVFSEAGARIDTKFYGKLHRSLSHASTTSLGLLFHFYKFLTFMSELKANFETNALNMLSLKREYQNDVLHVTPHPELSVNFKFLWSAVIS